MFLGETLCLVAYGIKVMLAKRQNVDPASPNTQKAEVTGLKTKINPLLFAIPASCDILASTLMFFGLVFAAASVYQMMRGAIVFITAIFSVIFLKRKQYRHHWSSLATIIIGITIVGVVSVVKSSDEEEGTKTEFIGILFLILSQIFAGVMFIVEEKLLSSYYLDPLKVVGWEGLNGFLIYVVILVIAQ